MTHTYAHPRLAVTVDAVVFHAASTGPSVLLIQRDRPPFEGAWALPGGFVEPGERLIEAALRELCEETGLVLAGATFVGVYDAPDRDPREHTISVAFVSALVAGPLPLVSPRDDARAVCWAPLDALPPLAFDHAEILANAARIGLPAPHAQELQVVTVPSEKEDS